MDIIFKEKLDLVCQVVIVNICNAILYESLWKDKKLKVNPSYVIKYTVQHDCVGVVSVC